MPKLVEIRDAVAAAITRDDDLVLAVQRPDEPGEELPGIWGLPATTLRDGESPEDGVRRLGREKLGVELTPLPVIGEGEQQRADYILRMTVYEASMTGEPTLRRVASGTTYDALDWLPGESFREAAERGSLCCEVYLASLNPGPSPDVSSLSPNPSPKMGEGRSEREPRFDVPEPIRKRMVQVARDFRKEPTKSEDILWQALRRRQLKGRKFRRQQPIGPFVVDFFCPDERLVVEVDGPIHDHQIESDHERQLLLEATGLRVVRLTAAEVERNLPGTLETVAASFSGDS